MQHLLVKALMLCLVLSCAQPLALAKKKKDTSLRLKSLETIYVEGFGQAADYIRRNLARETCLKQTTEESEADAILEIWEGTSPCRSALSGICQAISAKLRDRPSGEVLWFRRDDELRPALAIGTRDVAPKWVLWNLDSACCRGRASPPPTDP